MNEVFLNRMKTYLGEEYPAFETSLSRPLFKGLRYNPKKGIQPLKDLKKSPFCREGFYVDGSLGNHYGHITGAFYLQEPSASSAVTILDVKEDDIVLDLCAAPGGKSTQIEASLQDGFLVSNEIDQRRSKILLSNLERWGAQHILVTHTDPKNLCKQFAHCFTKVLVDAPCSGEGMMKKHEVSNVGWSQDLVNACAKRQKEILKHAYLALAKDGILVYSTCTYAKEENEDVISWFLEEYPDMELVDPQVSFGREGFLKHTRRIFPMDGGEGHFVAKLRKRDGHRASFVLRKNEKPNALVDAFLKEQLEQLPSYYYMQGDSVYVMDRPFIETKKLPVLRQGIFAGQLKKNRFEPAHAFYMNADWIGKYQKMWDVSLSEMNEFMHGSELPCTLEKGYYGLSYRGIPFGFGKSDGQRMKNKIPKGLRLNIRSNVLDETFSG